MDLLYTYKCINYNIIYKYYMIFRSEISMSFIEVYNIMNLQLLSCNIL